MSRFCRIIFELESWSEHVKILLYYFELESWSEHVKILPYICGVTLPKFVIHLWFIDFNTWFYITPRCYSMG